MDVTINGTATGTIDCKRLQLPGVSLSSTCPGCGETVTHDLDDYYLSHPTIGEPESYDFEHHDCPKPTGEWDSTEWVVWIQCDFTIKAVTAPDEVAS